MRVDVVAGVDCGDGVVDWLVCDVVAAMTLLIIILLVLILAGGGYGYRAGYVTPYNPVGIILLVLLVLLVLGAFGGPRLGWW